METQAISAPVDRLTRETPKRQAGYGLPCAKCHKYFPADLEVCPICKGRERVSPVVAPKIKKPVQSETSVAASSTNVALKQDVKESPKSESPALVPPIEIKVKDRSLDQKESIPTPVVAEIPDAVEPARTSVASTQPVLTQKEKEKESPKPESTTFAPSVEIKVKDQPLEKKQSITTPPLVEPPAAAESAPASLVSIQLALPPKEKESPAIAEIPAAVEPVLASLVTAPTDKESTKLESAASALLVEIKVEHQPLDQKESIPTSVVAEIPAAAEPARASLVSTQKKKETKSPKSESPALAPPLEIKVQDQPLDQKESTAVPVAQLPAPIEPLTASLVSTQKAKESSKSESPAVTFPNDLPNSDQPNQEELISTPALAEAQASDPVPAAVVPMPGEKEGTIELLATVPPTQPDTEEQRRDKINQALRIVIPMLVETQVSEPAPVAAKQEVLEQEKEEQAPKMSETSMSASEVKIAEARPVEVKTVASPAVVDQANHRPNEEKSKAIDKRVDAPKPADVNAPVVVHVNLGELRAAKSTPERAPAPSKKIEYTEAETNSSDISPDADTSESLAPVGGRKLDIVTFALGVVVLACAVLLITLAAIRLMPRNASEPVRRAKPAYSSASPTADQNINASTPTPQSAAPGPVNSPSSDSSLVVAPAAAPAPPSATSASNPSSSAGSERVLTLSEGLAEGNLLYRVEPDYPEEARRQGAQGPVVLDLHIGKEGLVQGVDLVSGQPLLVQAATAAVKQWRFRTRYVNGNEVEMQARITLHFALPTP